MRILSLTHRVPYPPNKGDKIRSFNVLRHLSERHDVCLATLVDDPQDLQSVEALESEVDRLICSRIDSPARKLLALNAMLTSVSITTRYFYSDELQREIDAYLDENSVDAVVCSTSPMAEYVFRSRHYSGKFAEAIKIMDMIDVDSLKWRQYSEQRSRLIAWLYRYESARLSDYETRIYREFHKTLLVSSSEMRCFPVPDDERKLEVVPNGVDLDYFSELDRRDAREEGPTIVFTGMMDYWPNIDGVRWFIDEVFCLIQEEIEDARFIVVGGRPTNEVRKWALVDGVEVTGFVPDVREFVEIADVCVAPLRVARGVQNKVLEAMAMGRPVVTTPFGLEGLDAKPDKDVAVAAEATEFARVVVELIRDRERANEMVRSARECVEANYTWTANLRKLDALLAMDPAAGI